MTAAKATRFLRDILHLASYRAICRTTEHNVPHDLEPGVQEVIVERDLILELVIHPDSGPLPNVVEVAEVERADVLARGPHQSWKPTDPQESLLVEQIAQNAWRLMRVRRLEAATLSSMMPSLVPAPPTAPGKSRMRTPADHDEAMARAFRDNAKAFDNLRRYATPIERAYHNAIAKLTKLKKQRKNSEIGFVSQPPRNPNQPAGRNHRSP